MRFIALVLRRLQRLIPVLIGVSVLCFALIRVLPGDPILSIVPETATTEDIKRARIRYGLDRPIIVQYVDYMAGVVRGDFGTSIQTNRSIDEQIRDGDYVLVEERKKAHNGETVVALIRGEETTLKKFYREKENIRLQPANEMLEPIYLDPEEMEIRGVVVGLFRKYGS